MNHYPIALFLHIVGALGFFVALGLEWLVVSQLRQATTSEQAGQWLGVTSMAGRVGMVSMVTLLISGIVMTATSWGMVAWIGVTLAAIALMAILSVAFSARRLGAIRRAVAAGRGPATPALRDALQHPLLWVGMRARVGVALGIIFLMTVKPDLGGSLLAIGLAAIVGLASALPSLGRSQREPLAEHPSGGDA